MAGYIAALYPLVIQTLRWIPKNERLELVFEAQERYEPFVQIMLSDIANNQRDPQIMTESGIPKLANWRFVPKDSTLLTQPADYFAYALTQIYRDKKSDKSRLCMPIMRDGEKSEAIGWIFTRDEVRGFLEFSRHLVNWQMIRGVDLSPKTPEQREAFNMTVQSILNWRRPSN